MINTTGDLIDRLLIINIKIWHLEEKIAKYQKKKNFEKIGKLALAIRQNNNIRVMLKNEITKRIDKIDMPDDKTNFTRG